MLARIFVRGRLNDPGAGECAPKGLERLEVAACIGKIAQLRVGLPADNLMNERVAIKRQLVGE